MARMILGGKIEEDVKTLSLSHFEKTDSEGLRETFPSDR